MITKWHIVDYSNSFILYQLVQTVRETESITRQVMTQNPSTCNITRTGNEKHCITCN